MSDGNIEPLVLDLVEFVLSGQRSYDEVMEAWRTNCPRLTVWEEAVSRNFVVCDRDARGNSVVLPTSEGMVALEKANRRKTVPDAA